MPFPPSAVARIGRDTSLRRDYLGVVHARWATVDDVGELVRLRQVMLDVMDLPPDDRWRPRVAEQLQEGLVDGRYFAAVVDAPNTSGLAGGGIGMVHERLAGPGDDGMLGYVMSMATDPDWRSKGVARSVLGLLLDGFRARGVRRVGLHATPHGEPLYRSFGFVEPRYPELRWYDR